MILCKFAPHVLLATGLISAGYIASTPDPIAEVAQVTQPPQATQKGPVNPSGPKILVAPEDMPTPLPQKEGEVWNSLVKAPGISIELDPSSVKITPVPGAFTVQTRFRMTFDEAFDVEGTKEKGWFYINTMTVNCTAKHISINESIAYTKEGKEIAKRKDLGVMPKAADPKSFINIWIQVACADLKGVKPPIFA